MKGMPRDRVELGELLHHLRGSTSRPGEIATMLHVSRQTYWRLEAGKTSAAPYAEDLDRIYGAEGALREAIIRIEQGRWDPWRVDEPRRLHIHRWPTAHHGIVWIRLKPDRHATVSTHHVDLVWGKWRSSVELELPPAGVTLVTGKSRDAVTAVDITLTVDPAAYALFGIDEPTTSPRVDIRGRWVTV
jgi:hypothetical protein